MVLAVIAAACSDRSDGASKASATTAPTGGTSSPISAGSATGPVTEADVTEIDEVLRRLDGELDRLDSDMAAGEGETQQVVLEARKRAATGAITRRLLALRERLTVAKSIVRLSDEHRSALTTQLQEQINGLTSLGARIQGDTDEATLRADAQRIVTDYRVYVLTIPKARGVMVADIEVAASDRLTRIADRLANAIDQARRDTTEAQEDLASMRSKLAAVDAAVLPIPAELLALQPAGYPANHAVLEQARQSLRTGRSDLADAAILARRVIADLK
jgi:chromosome segregation ATPase